MPQFGTPDGSSREEYLRKVCYKGLEERYGKERVAADKELRDRLDYELGIINQLKFPSYFLITADFINWAKDHDIPVGPGRGSAAGSLVAYAMKITNIDPLRFGLIFERFLNPERVSPPDIDIDFCQTRRPEVIDYVRQKYGERAVSHIITYGTMGAKSVLRDVARVMDMSYADGDRISKLIEPGPKVTLQSSYKSSEELRELIASDEGYAELWGYATRLEGLIRNVGVHAAGVVIGDRPLDEHVALTRDDLSDPHAAVVAQCDMSAIYEVGLLKMDFLGLKTLTVMHDAEEYARWRVPDFKLDSVPLDDRETLDLLNRGDTMGVFQLESGGMVDTCRRYGIQKIEDIIDLLALYRPGAMQFMDEMIEVKKGLRQVVYEHPLLEQVSGETYGVMIYQEQVQAAAKLLAGYTLGGADLLRRAMGKKDPAKMAKEKAHFVEGCWKTNQIDEKTATAIFDKIEKFAGYGFNKSHSACYGHISYWTAYLKAHFPVEFLCGLMSNEANNDKIGVFIQEANRMGIEILPPNVNKSMLKFTPEETPSGKLAVRYGLAAIKNVGEGAMQILLEERERNGEFTSMEDICNRLDSKSVNKKILESLIRAGALDWTLEPRCVLFERVDLALSGAFPGT
ncbi:MAG: DNA polymerase III subunit alpha [Akkermansia sp.]